MQLSYVACQWDPFGWVAIGRFLWVQKIYAEQFVHPNMRSIRLLQVQFVRPQRS